MAESGYALALHVNYTTPTILLQTYDKRWTDQYSQKSYVMQDPMVAWGFTHTGHCRWSDLEDDGPVLADAAAFGLKFGAAFAVERGGMRSFGSFARETREFTDDEIAICDSVMNELHDLTSKMQALPASAVEKLKKGGARGELHRLIRFRSASRV